MAEVMIPEEEVLSMIEKAGKEAVKRFLYRYKEPLSYETGIINQFCRWVLVDEYLFDEIMHTVARRMDYETDSSDFNDRFFVTRFCKYGIDDVMSHLSLYEELFEEADSVLMAILCHLTENYVADNETPFIDYCNSVVNAMKDKVG